MKTKTIKRVYHVQSSSLQKAHFPFVGDLVSYQGNYFFVSEFIPFRKYNLKTCCGCFECCDSSFRGLVHFGPFVCSFESLEFIGWASSDPSGNCRFAYWGFKA